MDVLLWWLQQTLPCMQRARLGHLAAAEQLPCSWVRAACSLVFKCPALQDLRDRYENLLQGPQGNATLLFMWQDDIIGVV